ncbi:hypothetical protein [Flavobacterium sp.]|uniref:hypothetical protein n=1 Tax=Flavobacterium sp. TaxID=239 RepID=UPI003C4C2C86
MNYFSLFLVSSLVSLHAQDKKISLLTSKAKLIFEDNFNREEKNDALEDLGLGWQTNSKARASGHKQADLREGVLFIEKYKNADHSTSILHAAPFDDGIVKVKFNMHSSKGFKLNFNDPKAKELSHAGHIAQVSVTPLEISVMDQLTGIFSMAIYEKRKAGMDKNETQALIKDKTQNYPVQLSLNQWYEITILFEKETLSVWIDDKFMGAFKSTGFDHSVKENIAFSLASASASFDDLKIWSLDKN